MKSIVTKVLNFFRGIWEFLLPIWEEAPAIFIIPAWGLFFLVLYFVPGILAKTSVGIGTWVILVLIHCVVMAMKDKTLPDDWVSRRWQ